MECFIDNLIGFGLCIIGLFFVYMSNHIIEEEKRGEYIDLPWEKKKDGKQ